ncbi:MAG: VOC family protein [Rhodobacteraceae bacterium]|nr:VOC family protein [Paracoccaceae bacterium]
MTVQTSLYFDLDAAPLSVDHATLLVHDLDRLTRFYIEVLGFRVHHQTTDQVLLGAQTPFLTLKNSPDAARADPNAPGLFHIAYLLPNRVDLASWLQHLAQNGLRPQGASDHNVSEAIYLSDPEGNGIEVYVDRPTSGWKDAQGAIYMPSLRLDTSTLPEPQAWTGVPEKTRIGHVHLQTTDIASAETFWTGLRMDVTARYPGGSFFGSGGYHHQIAANVWRSSGRAVEPGPKTGLSQLTFAVDRGLTTSAVTHLAPSGVDITLQPKGL